MNRIKNSPNTPRWFSTFLIACAMGLSQSSMAAPPAASSLKACQQAQAMLSITPQQQSPATLYRNSSVDVIYNIVNNVADLSQGLTALATSLVPNDPGLTVSVMNSCAKNKLLKSAQCSQTVTINATDGVATGTYNLNVFTCNADTPTKYCASTCQPFQINVPPVVTPTRTTISVSPNPVVLDASGSPQTIMVTNMGPVNATNIGFTSPPPIVTVTPLPAPLTCSGSLPPNGSCGFTVTPGVIQGTGSFNITADNASPVTESVTVGPPISISVIPSSVSLAVNGMFDVVVQNLTNVNVSNLAATIDSPTLGVTVTGFGTANCPAPLPPAGMGVCTLTVNAAGTTGNTTIHISGVLPSAQPTNIVDVAVQVQ